MTEINMPNPLDPRDDQRVIQRSDQINHHQSGFDEIIYEWRTMLLQHLEGQLLMNPCLPLKFRHLASARDRDL
jgi:hypothetical protein